jgi:acyl carrier protein
MNTEGSLSIQAPAEAGPAGQPAADRLAIALAAYRQVLGIAEVQPDDDFFELGGDSMQAIDVVSIIEAAIGAEISAALFFTYPTPAELASVLPAAGPAE